MRNKINIKIKRVSTKRDLIFFYNNLLNNK